MDAPGKNGRTLRGWAPKCPAVAAVAIWRSDRALPPKPLPGWILSGKPAAPSLGNFAHRVQEGAAASSRISPHEPYKALRTVRLGRRFRVNRFFGELPTPLPCTAAVQALHLERVALVFATGEVRIAKLELCPIPDSSHVALSAKLERLSENPRDGLIQYLTREAVENIHPDPRAAVSGTRLCLDLASN